jgi:hypothetical protein
MNWRVRNLPARIGEMYFLSRALPAEEIKRLYEGTVSQRREEKTSDRRGATGGHRAIGAGIPTPP